MFKFLNLKQSKYVIILNYSVIEVNLIYIIVSSLETELLLIKNLKSRVQTEYDVANSWGNLLKHL